MPYTLPHMRGPHFRSLLLPLALAAFLLPPTASAIMSVEELNDTDPRVAQLPTMVPLQAAWGEVTAVDIELQTPADHKKPRRIRINRPESITALIAAIDIRQPQPREITRACVCGGCITFTFQRLGKSPLVLELRSETHLRWVDGFWISDATVSDTGSRALADWMKANQINVSWYWQRQEQAKLELKQRTAAIENAMGPELTAFVREAGKRIKLADKKRIKADAPPTPATASIAPGDTVLPGYELDWPKAGPVATGVALARVLAVHAHTGTSDDLDTIRRILTDFAVRDDAQDLLRACEADGRALIAFAKMFSDTTDTSNVGYTQNLNQDAYAEWSVRIAKARLTHDTGGELASVVNTLLGDAEADADGAITRWLHAIAEEKTPCAMCHADGLFEHPDAGEIKATLPMSARAAVYVCLPLALREDHAVVLGLVDRLERVHAAGTAKPLSRYERSILDITRGLCGQYRYFQISHLLTDAEVSTYAARGYEAIGEPWAMGVLFGAYDNFGLISADNEDNETVNAAIEEALLRQTKHLLTASDEGRKILEMPAYSEDRRKALTAWWKHHHKAWTAPEPEAEPDAPADEEG